MSENAISQFTANDFSRIMHFSGTNFFKSLEPKEIDLGVFLVYGPDDTNLFYREIENLRVGDEVFLREGGIPYKLNMSGRSILVCKESGGSIGMLDKEPDKLCASLIHNGYKLVANVNMINTSIPMNEYRSWKPFNIRVTLVDDRKLSPLGVLRAGRVAVRNTKSKEMFLLRDKIDVAYIDRNKMLLLNQQKIGDNLRFVHKADEHKDGKYTVQIITADKQTIGYVNGRITGMISKMLDSGMSIRAVLRSTAKFRKTEQGTIFMAESPEIDIVMDDYSYDMSSDYYDQEPDEIDALFKEWLNHECVKPEVDVEEVHLGCARIFGLRDELRLKKILCGLRIGDPIKLAYTKKRVSVTDDNTGETRMEDDESIRVDAYDGECMGFMQSREDMLVIKLLKLGMNVRAEVKEINLAEPFNRRNALVLDLYLSGEIREMIGSDSQILLGEGDAPNIDEHDDNVGTRFDIGFANDLKKMEDASEKLSRIRPGDKLKFVREPDNQDDPNAVMVYTMDDVSLGYLYHYNCEFIPNLMDAGNLVYGVVRSVHDEGKPIFASMDFFIYVLF